MPTRRILSYREAQALVLNTEAISGKRLVLASRFEPEPGRILCGGEDVTEEALGWANLPSLVKRGVVRLVDTRQASADVASVAPMLTDGDGGVVGAIADDDDAGDDRVNDPASRAPRKRRTRMV